MAFNHLKQLPENILLSQIYDMAKSKIRCAMRCDMVRCDTMQCDANCDALRCDTVLHWMLGMFLQELVSRFLKAVSFAQKLVSQ